MCVPALADTFDDVVQSALVSWPVSSRYVLTGWRNRGSRGSRPGFHCQHAITTAPADFSVAPSLARLAENGSLPLVAPGSASAWAGLGTSSAFTLLWTAGSLKRVSTTLWQRRLQTRRLPLSPAPSADEATSPHELSGPFHGALLWLASHVHSLACGVSFYITRSVYSLNVDCTLDSNSLE